MAMLLKDYLNQVYVVHRQIKGNSSYQVLRSIERFSLWLERPALVEDLTGDKLSHFLLASEKTYAPVTLKKMRGHLIGLWRDAVEHGELATPPGRVRKIKVPPPDPQIWIPGDVQDLMHAAERLTGKLRDYLPDGRSFAAYFTNLISATWTTGLRRGDLWKIDKSMISPDGTIRLRMGKTGMVHCCKIRMDVYRWIMMCVAEKPFEWPGSKQTFYYWWKQLKKLSRVTTPGALQRIRRSAATQVARESRGAQTQFLGHTTPAADVFYVPLDVIRDMAPIMPADFVAKMEGGAPDA